MSTRKDFSQIPNVLFDMELLPEESYLVGFLRLWRLYAHRADSFTGSYRRLANLIKLPKSCIARMVPAWENAGLVTKESCLKENENREEMKLIINVDAIWEFNDAYYADPYHCPNLGQRKIITVPSLDTVVPNWDTPVPSWDNNGPIWDNGVPPVRSNSGVIHSNTENTNRIQINTLESSGNIVTHLTFASYDATLLSEKKAESLKSQEVLEPLTQETQVIPSQENKTPEIEAQAQNKPVGKVSDSQKTTKKLPRQQALIEKPKQPQMPPAILAWGPEKMVQITEARRFSRDKQGAYFSDEVRGNGKSKLSQRQKQLEVAKKIIALGITEEQYIRAYDKRNDAWWNERGSLTVDDMYAKTSKGNIRILEVLEALDSKSTINGNSRIFPTVSPQSSNVSSFRAPTGLVDKDEMNKLMDMDPAERKAYALAKRQARLEQERQQRAAL